MSVFSLKYTQIKVKQPRPSQHLANPLATSAIRHMTKATLLLVALVSALAGSACAQEEASNTKKLLACTAELPGSCQNLITAELEHCGGGAAAEQPALPSNASVPVATPAHRALQAQVRTQTRPMTSVHTSALTPPCCSTTTYV